MTSTDQRKHLPGPLAVQMLKDVPGLWRGVVAAGEPGIAAGLGLADGRPLVTEGAAVRAGDALLEVSGSAVELALAEDHVLGHIGVASGVATAAARVLGAAPPQLRVVCGGWKKLPAGLKPAVRAGLAAAGMSPRLLDGDFCYVAKNEIRLLGGVAEAVAAGLAMDNGPVAIQVRTAAEAREAAAAGARVVMVDTGDPADLHDVAAALSRSAEPVDIAFAGGVRADDLISLAAAGADVVDVGRAVLATPLLDLRFDVVDRDA